MSGPVNIRATDDVALQAAEEAAFAGASALRAVAAGYMAAAGEHAGVLLSSATILVHGFGAARSFDGRLRQPGVGARRPRGWTSIDEVPDVAWVAAPSNIPALFVALTYDEDRRNSMVFRAGVARARAAGANERALLIQGIADRGGNAWADPALHRTLLHAAGPIQSGMLARADFDVPESIDVACERRQRDGYTALCAPWDNEGESGVSGCTLEAICAIDRRGTAAAIVYERCLDGVDLPELELLAPRAAQAVLRGVTRVRPGIARAMPCPVEIQLSATNVVQAVRVTGANPMRVVPVD